jgi:release factor glutamine methyltransferase
MEQIEKIFFNEFEFLLKKDDQVYFPSDDTFLVLRNLKNLKGDILEIGTASGLISIYIVKKFNCKVLASDINKKALLNASYNASLNNVETKIEFLYSDLFSKINKKKFDFIIFNPPYLPTSKNEILKKPLNYAFDGGKSGLKVIKKFLKQAKNFLKENGTIFLVASSLSDLNQLESFLKKLGYNFKVVDKMSFFFERIVLYKIKKITKINEI